MLDREKIDKKYTWDLEAIYKDSSSFDGDVSRVLELISKIGDYEKKMLDSAEEFYNTIKLSYDIERILDKLSVYASLLFDLDTSNNENQALVEKISNLRCEYNRKSYFIVPNILKLDYSTICKYYDEKKELRDYEINLKNIYRYKDHTLSDVEEKLLSNINKIIGNCYDTYELLKDCDISFDSITVSDGKEVELTNSNYSIYIEDSDRCVRRDAFMTLYKTYKQYANTYASLLFSNEKELSMLAKIEKYNSAIEMSLFKDEVNISVYDNLINTVHNNMSIIYKYYKLKKDILKLDELHLYDIYVPITLNYDKSYEYDEAKDIVLDVLKIFGDEYIGKVKEALDSRWIDVYPTRNKRTGGYSGGSFDTYPYILLNYQNKYNDMSTLIHEMGHSMHSYYSRSNNDYQNSDYRIFVAEVASTVNELLLSYYMLEHSKQKEERLFILNNLMELYRATIYRQTMFAEFEKIISSKCDNNEALTSDMLSSIYYDLNKLYFGEDVVIDEEIKYEWTRIPHFYYDFYVYKYATGLSAATSIVKNILDKKENAIENYIEFLKCGSSKSPIDSLKVAGVDLNCPKVIEDALFAFNDIIDMYKKETN